MSSANISLLQTSAGLQRTVGRRPFASASRNVNSGKCKASQTPSDGIKHEVRLERRDLLLAGLSTGIFASMATAQSVHAESACSDFATASNGIKWCETKEGSGKAPTKGQLIRCHYTGRLTSNGSVFDSSYDRRRPLSFKVGAREVIQGWDKSILGEDDLPPMKEGGKRRVIIPSDLAYGSRGAGGVIPPNATLTFDIELLGKR